MTNILLLNNQSPDLKNFPTSRKVEVFSAKVIKYSNNKWLEHANHTGCDVLKRPLAKAYVPFQNNGAISQILPGRPREQSRFV